MIEDHEQKKKRTARLRAHISRQVQRVKYEKLNMDDVDAIQQNEVASMQSVDAEDHIDFGRWSDVE